MHSTQPHSKTTTTRTKVRFLQPRGEQALRINYLERPWPSRCRPVVELRLDQRRWRPRGTPRRAAARRRRARPSLGAPPRAAPRPSLPPPTHDADLLPSSSGRPPAAYTRINTLAGFGNAKGLEENWGRGAEGFWSLDNGRQSARSSWVGWGNLGVTEDFYSRMEADSWGQGALWNTFATRLRIVSFLPPQINGVLNCNQLFQFLLRIHWIWIFKIIRVFIFVDGESISIDIH